MLIFYVQIRHMKEDLEQEPDCKLVEENCVKPTSSFFMILSVTSTPSLYHLRGNGCQSCNGKKYNKTPFEPVAYVSLFH